MSRQARSWLFAAGLLLAAGGAYLWTGGGPIATPAPPLLASPEEIRGLRLTPAGGEALAFRREGEGFRLTEPIETPADLQKVHALLEQLAALGPGEAVAMGEKPLSTFGLDPPAWTLELELAAGPRRLELGAESPFDGRSYLRVDGERLVLISGALARRLDPRPKHWREKRMVPAAPESLDHLRFQWEGRDLTLQRRQERWVLVEPDERTLPANLARRLIRLVTENRAVAFETEAGELPAADAPWEARLEVGSGDRRRGIELFALDQDGGPGIQARGTALSPWVRLRPGAYEDFRALFGFFAGQPPRGSDPAPD